MSHTRAVKNLNLTILVFLNQPIDSSDATLESAFEQPQVELLDFDVTFFF